MLRHHFAVDRVIVMLDAVNGRAHLASQPEAAKQIAVADQLVITKVDLVEPDALHGLAGALAALNPSAAIRTALHGVVAERAPLRAGVAHGPRPEPALTGGHTDDVRQLSLDLPGGVDWLAFSAWLSMLLHVHGERVLRVKGLVPIEPGVRVAITTVQHVVHRPEHLPAGTEPHERPRLVFITRGLPVDGLARSLRGVPAAPGAS